MAFGVSLKVIDVHTHVGEDKDGSSQTLEHLEKSMDSCGISASVVFPFDMNGDLVEASLGLLKRKSDRIFPFLRFDPKHTSAGRVRELLSRKEFMGVKLHPRSQNFDPLDKKFYPIYEEIESSGVPLLFHTRKEQTPYSDPDRVTDLADDFPAMNIIIGHFAFCSAVAMGKIKSHKNLYVETSIVSSNVAIKNVSRNIGSSKIIFGSDSPMSDQEIELLKIKKSGLGEDDKEKILYRNISGLLNIS